MPRRRRGVAAGERTVFGSAVVPGVGSDSLLLRAFCHELRSPISALGSLTRALAEEPGRLSPPQRREILALVREQVLHLDGVWRQAAALAGGTAPPASPPRRPLREVLPAVLGPVPPARLRVGLGRAAGERLVPAQAVRQVLINLVENALRHGPPDGRVSLGATIRRGDLVLVVVDEGLSCARLVAALRRTAPPPGSRGLGLWLVRRLVEAEGGRVAAYRRRPRGVAVEVVLPAGPARPAPARGWPRWVSGWPRRVRGMGMGLASAIRDQGGHRVQSRQGSAVRGQAGRA